MVSGEVLLVVSTLSESEKTLMRELARVAKSKTNVFSEEQLKIRKSLEDIDVRATLRSAAASGLVQPVRRGRWRTTGLGRKVEHFLWEQWIQNRYPYAVVRR